jgi:hypothetical protein
MTDLVKAYRRDLDRALRAGPDALLAFIREQGLRDPSCRDVLLMTFHKTVTASRTLPKEVRRASKAWLTMRGCHSLDDGDL